MKLKKITKINAVALGAIITPIIALSVVSYKIQDKKIKVKRYVTDFDTSSEFPNTSWTTNTTYKFEKNSEKYNWKQKGGRYLGSSLSWRYEKLSNSIKAVVSIEKSFEEAKIENFWTGKKRKETRLVNVRIVWKGNTDFEAKLFDKRIQKKVEHSIFYIYNGNAKSSQTATHYEINKPSKKTILHFRSFWSPNVDRLDFYNVSDRNINFSNTKDFSWLKTMSTSIRVESWFQNKKYYWTFVN